MSSTPRRKNGLSAPHSYMQISTWVFLPTLVIEYLVVCSPNLPLAASIPVTLIFCVLSFIAALYGYLATVTDSMDTHLACHLRDQGESSPPPPSGCLALFTTTSDFTPAQLQAETTKYCWVCETNVAQHSMHCKYCNKCVSKFDHHCQWLNTCVGEKNYPYFYKTLWFISSLLVVHGGTSMAIGIDIVTNGVTENLADNWLGGSGLKMIVVVVCFMFFLLDMVALSLIAQLLLFHISLRREALTTYQFIVRDNQRKRDKTQISDAQKAKRIVAIGTAKREGKTMLVYQLQCGKYCKPCDPLVVEDTTTKQEATERNAPPPDAELPDVEESKLVDDEESR